MKYDIKNKRQKIGTRSKIQEEHTRSQLGRGNEGALLTKWKDLAVTFLTPKDMDQG